MNNTIAFIGKIILAVTITGILGAGAFCGGVFLIMVDLSIVGFLVWGAGIILYFYIMKGIFYKKRSPKDLEPSLIVLPVTNKYQKAVVDYITQARVAHLTDHAITANLLGAGWIESDINFGFEAVGGRK